MRTLVPAVLALIACKGEPEPGLPAVLSGAVETEECATVEVDGCRMGAATTYWAGDYAFEGTAVTGFEYWYWIPNDLLADQSDDWEPETPCLMQWAFAGEKDDAPDPADCPACEYTLTGSATFLADESDCPADLEQAYGIAMSIAYAVRDGDRDNVELYFESGTHVATGEPTASGMWWRSDALCEIAGASEEGCVPE